MSKSILIVNTPENCGKCDFIDNRLDGTHRCIMNKDSSNVVEISTIPDWCLIRDLPKKKEVKNFCLGERDFEQKGYQEGFNACIDEILKLDSIN